MGHQSIAILTCNHLPVSTSHLSWHVMAKAVLSFHQLVENSDESFLLDNEALNLWDRKPFAPVGVAGSHLVNVRC